MKPLNSLAWVVGMTVMLTVGLIRAEGVIDVTINPATGLTISTAGSYRLVSNVTMTANVRAVNLTTDNVSLDLNGHTITAVAGSTTEGIYGNYSRVTISNGRILDFGKNGLYLGSSARVLQVHFVGCCKGAGYSVLGVGAGSHVEGCTFIENSPTSAGNLYVLATSQNCIVTRNILHNNTCTNGINRAIWTQNGCSISDNIIEGTTVSGGTSACQGIFSEADCTINGNSIINTDNTGTGAAIGIQFGNRCIVKENLVSGNDTSSTAIGPAVGIYTLGSNSQIVENSSTNHTAAAGGSGTAYGIYAAGQNRIRENLCNSIYSGSNGTSAGIYLSGNYCLVEQNECVFVSGGLRGYGIHVVGSGNTVTDNTCTTSETAGMFFTVATDNRADSNRVRGALAIDLANGGVNPESLGAGDLANITY